MEALSDPGFMAETLTDIENGAMTFQSVSDLVRQIQPSRSAPFLNVLGSVLERRNLTKYLQGGNHNAGE
jgi:hypothetical protein